MAACGGLRALVIVRLFNLTVDQILLPLEAGTDHVKDYFL